MKLLRSRVDEKRANLKSVYYVDCCVASLPAPPPPPCFAGWSPSPAIAVADEERPPPAGRPALPDTPGRLVTSREIVGPGTRRQIISSGSCRFRTCIRHRRERRRW
jgi:hypothetical protein